MPRWVGVTGLVVSALYLLNQGDVSATAVPGFPVWDLAGPLGSTGWGLWVAALGVTVLRHPVATAPRRHSHRRRHCHCAVLSALVRPTGRRVGAATASSGAAPT